MLNADVQALVTVLKCVQRKVVSSMAEEFHIPHLSVDIDPCPSRTPEEFTIHLTQEYNNIDVVLFDIMQAIGQYYITIDLNHKFGNPSFYNHFTDLR